MAATDQTYRNQRTLDIVFAVSCLLMLVGTIWMFAADYNREWKPVQRKFRDIETAQAQRLTLESLPPPSLMAERSYNLAELRKARDAAREQLRAKQNELKVERDKATVTFQTWKAEVDASASRYDAAIEKA